MIAIFARTLSGRTHAGRRLAGVLPRAPPALSVTREPKQFPVRDLALLGQDKPACGARQQGITTLREPFGEGDRGVMASGPTAPPYGAGSSCTSWLGFLAGLEVVAAPSRGEGQSGPVGLAPGRPAVSAQACQGAQLGDVCESIVRKALCYGHQLSAAD